jgi:hypothetical protein
LPAYLHFSPAYPTIIVSVGQVVDGVVHIISVVDVDRIPVACIVHCEGAVTFVYTVLGQSEPVKAGAGKNGRCVIERMALVSVWRLLQSETAGITIIRQV